MMTTKREPHPLAGREVLLNEKASDPQRSMLYPGAKFRVVEWYVNMDSEATEPVTVARNMAEGWYLARAAANGLPLEELVYGKVRNLGHLVHVSELGEEVIEDE